MTIKHRAGRALGVALIAVTLGACDFISPIESNPNAVPAATLDQLFTAAQVNSYFLAAGDLSRIASIWTQQMAGTDRQFVSFDNYVISDSDFDDPFNTAYTGGGLLDIREAIRQAEASAVSQYAGILKIHEVYMMGLIASFYGDIPYAEAVDPAVTAPALDDQAAVYTALQARLDEAITDLGVASAGPGALDMNFAGNAARWIAVARTLKARYYMHWGEVSGVTAYTAARTALTTGAGGVTTVAGNWEAKFGTAQTEANMWWHFQIQRSGYISAGDFMVPLMVANADPRLPRYYTTTTPTSGVYAARASDVSDTGFGSAGFDFPMVTCAETYFILAEAEYRLGNTVAARTAANSGLACEEAEYAISLASQATAINTLLGAALLEKIMEQKYIAMFLNPEAFNDYKRTCMPTAMVERSGGMPGRLFYSEQERRTNPNVPATGTDPNDKYNDNDPTPCP